MASVPTTTSSARSRWFRPVVYSLVGAGIIAFVSAVAWSYLLAASALPQVDGSTGVDGLTARVTVTRDAHGVPTIEASNFDDLFFAQGYVTASDRLFQMDASRRYAAGELAEIVGEGQVEHDRQQRILGLRVAAKKITEIAPPEDRRHFEAYARGVNAYIESHRDRLPIEFRLLRYSPKPWSFEDSALIAAYMVEDLSASPRHALAREKILAKLGPDLASDLYVNSSWRDHPPTVVHADLEEKNDTDEDEDDEDDDGPDSSVVQAIPSPIQLPPARAFFDDPPAVIGSNNWVVSGAHTVSGKPLLSNDMHLGHQMPNLWYAAHLRCGNYDVAGVTLPGYPFVVVGHNQRIAWGFTNLGPTVEDAYVETFNADGQYQTPDGWKSPEHRQEVIHVEGKPDVTLEVVVTRHGPIVSDLVPGETRKLALRWTLYDGLRNPFFAVNSAQNWADFRQAFSQLDAPAQSVVYADVDGNIGYQATGKIPIRTTGDGSLPEDGANDAHEWKDYVPFDKLPSILNPANGIIATANSRIAPDGYAYSLSTEWDAPWRAARIYRVLESGKKFSAADMLSLQMDIYSDADRFFAEKFVYAIDHSNNASARAKAAADILRQWDGRMLADSAAPTIAVRSREELTRLLLEPKLGQAPADPKLAKATLNWKTYAWMRQSVWLDNVMQHQPKRWLPDNYTSYDQLLAAAVDAAVNRPEAPKDLAQWSWGKTNFIEIQSPVLGRVPIVRHWTGTGVYPLSGSVYTVKAVNSEHGPSERITDDLANLDQSTLNLVTGEAGNFLSPWYLDQWNAWYKGTTFPWPFSPDATLHAKKHMLTLEPNP